MTPRPYFGQDINPYIGRFAPSPTGLLHIGSLVTALASYLDAKVHHGLWRVRMEDVDEARSVPGVAQQILHSLHHLGLDWDGDVLWQSERKAQYHAAQQSIAAFCYGCGCFRREIADSRLGLAADGAAIYPGTCRHGVAPGRVARTLRLRVPDEDEANIQFIDRRLGPMSQNLAREAGDFVLQRADGFWAYQLAVVVDDIAQGITSVVRGEDLLDSTARQIYLYQLLGHPPPTFLHVPVVRNAEGQKLSKQTGAPPLDLNQPLQCLQLAAQHLGLGWLNAPDTAQFWPLCMAAWAKQIML